MQVNITGYCIRTDIIKEKRSFAKKFCNITIQTTWTRENSNFELSKKTDQFYFLEFIFILIVKQVFKSWIIILDDCFLSFFCQMVRLEPSAFHLLSFLATNLLLLIEIESESWHTPFKLEIWLFRSQVLRQYQNNIAICGYRVLWSTTLSMFFLKDQSPWTSYVTGYEKYWSLMKNQSVRKQEITESVKGLTKQWHNYQRWLSFNWGVVPLFH